MRQKYLSIAVLLLVSLGLSSGCSSVGFYSQAIWGHLQVMRAREPIEQVLKAPETSEALAARLRLSQQARRFAVSRLGLPDNDSYSSYVRTGRAFVTWNVVAAPAFGFEAKQWCFLMIGCLAYRGYYQEQKARDYAANLAEQRWDVAVNGATAYSTLGWFDDPLLDTMLRNYNDLGLVGVIFHELAHQQLYVKGDSEFNESFATFVEHQGMREWLQQGGEAGQTLEQYREGQQRREGFLALLSETREGLEALYAESGLSEAERQSRKQQQFAAMRERYAELKRSWGGYRGYDLWFERPLNNARLVAVKTYTGWIPAFAQLYAQVEGDWTRFYARCRALADLPVAERKARLQALSQQAEWQT